MLDQGRSIGRSPLAATWDGAHIANIVALDRIEDDVFECRTHVLDPGKHIFGGQVVALAIAAACRTVRDKLPNSLHAMFLRGGDNTRPIRLRVDNLRDGRRFGTRRVTASQDCRVLFEAMISFRAGFAPLVRHSVPMDDAIPSPDALPETALDEALAGSEGERFMNRLRWVPGVEMRPFGIGGAFRDGQPLRRIWFRMPLAAQLADTAGHLPLLGYLTDYGLAGTVLAAHIAATERRLIMTSLDHAVWFHRPARVDDWLLYDMISPHAEGGTGLATGHIYDRHGQLVASVAQEALVLDAAAAMAGPLLPEAG